MVGARLQQARSERNLSLTDVAHRTKIQPWVVEALEADRLQELMSPVYVKSFLTSYAKFLRLEPEPLVAQLRWPQSERPQEVPPAPEPPVVQWPAVPLSSGLLRVIRIGGALAVSAALVGLVVVPRLRRSAPASSSNGRALASISGVQEPVNAPELPALTLLPTQPLALGLTATRTAWVRVRADGKLVSQQRLARGANEQWTAKNRFEVIVTKPTQIELTLNGQSITPFAVAHHGRLLITRYGITRLPEENP